MFATDILTNLFAALPSEINLAFKFNKPAVINTHRVNFIGGIEEKNRDLGLKKLNILLCQIVKKWPDVKFMNSAQLGNYISNSNL
jgi:hypothetical protein